MASVPRKPYYVECGRKRSYESEPGDVGVYVRVDMPGVPNGGVAWEHMDDGRSLSFTGIAPKYHQSHDPEVKYSGIVKLDQKFIDFHYTVENGRFNMFFVGCLNASVTLLPLLDETNAEALALAPLETLRDQVQQSSHNIIHRLTKVVEDNSRELKKLLSPRNQEPLVPPQIEKPSSLPVFKPPMTHDHYFIDDSEYGSGSSGVVYKGWDTNTREQMAFKVMRLSSGYSICKKLVRELFTLYENSHPNIVELKNVYVFGHILILAMEGLSGDLFEAMKERREGLRFNAREILRQILEAIQYMHSRSIVHRDLKMENILIVNPNSKSPIVKVADFGFARLLGSDLTPQVTSMRFRAPELLLGSNKYAQPMDMWGVGCIFAELVDHKAPFYCEPGKMTIDTMLLAIFRVLGTPTEASWPEARHMPNFPSKEEEFVGGPFTSSQLTDDGNDLLSRLLCMNPSKRITATEALAHRYFCTDT